VVGELEAAGADGAWDWASGLRSQPEIAVAAIAASNSEHARAM